MNDPVKAIRKELERLIPKHRSLGEEIQRLHQALYLLGQKKRKRKPASLETRQAISDAHKRRPLSAEARKRIADGQKKRWAEHRAEQTKKGELHD